MVFSGVVIKNSSNGKTGSARGTMGRGKRRVLPLCTMPARSLFLSPQPPYDTKRPLGGESRLHSLFHRGLFSSKLCLRGLRCCSRPSSSKDD